MNKRLLEDINNVVNERSRLDHFSSLGKADNAISDIVDAIQNKLGKFPSFNELYSSFGGVQAARASSPAAKNAMLKSRKKYEEIKEKIDNGGKNRGEIQSALKEFQNYLKGIREEIEQDEFLILVETIQHIVNERLNLAGNTEQNFSRSVPDAKERANIENERRHGEERRKKVLSPEEKKKIVDQRMAERRKLKGAGKKKSAMDTMNDIINRLGGGKKQEVNLSKLR